MGAVFVGLRAIGRLWRRRDARTLFFTAGLMLGAGTLFYVLDEGWSAVDAFYFSVTTLTTTGYGDFHPTTVESKLFTSFYLLGGVGVFVAVVAAIAREALALRAHQLGVED